MASREAMRVPAAGVNEAPATESVWSGGVSPYAVSSKKLGMWLFIVSDAITFSALLMAYSYVRVASEHWPMPFEWPSILNATVMTGVLLSSSLTMVMAVRAAKMANRKAAVGWLLATMLGGIAFDVLHLREWGGLIEEGVRLFKNPWGTPLFGASFFGLTGLHMTHVTVGVVYLGVVAAGLPSPKFPPDAWRGGASSCNSGDLEWRFFFRSVYLFQPSQP